MAGLSVVLLLALLQRLLFLGQDSLTLDESVSAWMARLSWSRFLPVVWNGDASVGLFGEANMGLYYVLLHGWAALGRNEFALRALSVLVSVATVPLFYASLCFVCGIQRPSWRIWTCFFGIFVFAAHWAAVVVLRRRGVPWRT